MIASRRPVSGWERSGKGIGMNIELTTREDTWSSAAKARRDQTRMCRGPELSGLPQLDKRLWGLLDARHPPTQTAPTMQVRRLFYTLTRPRAGPMQLAARDSPLARLAQAAPLPAYSCSARAATAFA